MVSQVVPTGSGKPDRDPQDFAVSARQRPHR